MEFAEKGDLLSYFIKKGKEQNTIVPESEIWRTCKFISEGLAIHRDIKPQNVLVMADLSFKVSSSYN